MPIYQRVSSNSTISQVSLLYKPSAHLVEKVQPDEGWSIVMVGKTAGEIAHMLECNGNIHLQICKRFGHPYAIVVS